MPSSITRQSGHYACIGIGRDRQVYRRTYWVLALAIVLIGGAALQLLITAYLGWDATTGVFASVIALGLLALGVAQLRSRLEVDPDEMVIVNGFVRHIVPDPEIATVTADRYRSSREPW